MRHQTSPFTIPKETILVARAAFPKGNNYMTMRDEINRIYADSRLGHLFSHAGRPAEAPGNLALVLVMQYAEGLSDRQAAEAVRARIDWKYALALKLSDSGFTHGVLTQFRDRLLAGSEEMVLLEDMLSRFSDLGLLKSRGKQRTDSTHIVAATRRLNRLEMVGETMRQVLNVLATAYPDWLREQLDADWFDLYGPRFEEYRLPKTAKERLSLAEKMGRDGVYLLGRMHSEAAPVGMHNLPAVEILRRVWIQQFYHEEGVLRWRQKQQGLPPVSEQIQTPYDVEARFSRKRSTEWTGYKVHYTETCTADAPNLITHVLTTVATRPDHKVLPEIQQTLVERERGPTCHLVDAGYVDAGNLATSHAMGIDLFGPAQADTTWQGKDPDAFDLSRFDVDWQAEQVTCPDGKKSHTWSKSKDRYNRVCIHVRFVRQDCVSCAQRVSCTRSEKNGRSLKLYTEEEHQALQIARLRQITPEFKEQYQRRAGVEGTISQGARGFDLRRTRYTSMAKTHLHNILVAAAINLTRAVAWLRDVPRAKTRTSAFMKLAVA